MITLEQYVGVHARSPDWTTKRQANARMLVLTVNAMISVAENDGVDFPINPKTGSQISGNTFGGFRPQSCSQGAPNSNHKEGLGVDLYDPDNEIDAWMLANEAVLEKLGIWIESPTATPSWAHLQTVPPRSGRRVYMP
jgi:hypothetical protein